MCHWVTELDEQVKKQVMSIVVVQLLLCKLNELYV